MNIEIRTLEPYSDERGWVDEIYSGELGADLKNIHIGTMQPGVTRGNHRHPNSFEWITFQNGTVEVVFEYQHETQSRIPETPFEVYLPSGVAHAFTNRGNETVYFTAYRDVNYDENPDTEDYELT